MRSFRDVRRLVVAMSRARLGLYIFGRVNLFERSVQREDRDFIHRILIIDCSCFELTPAFNILTKRPVKLYLLPNETYPSVREVCSNSIRMKRVIISRFAI